MIPYFGIPLGEAPDSPVCIDEGLALGLELPQQSLAAERVPTLCLKQV